MSECHQCHRVSHRPWKANIYRLICRHESKSMPHLTPEWMGVWKGNIHLWCHFGISAVPEPFKRNQWNGFRIIQAHVGKLTQLGGADRSMEGKLSLLGEEQIYELESITYQQKYKPNIRKKMLKNEHNRNHASWASNRYTNKRWIGREIEKKRNMRHNPINPDMDRKVVSFSILQNLFLKKGLGQGSVAGGLMGKHLPQNRSSHTRFYHHHHRL